MERSQTQHLSTANLRTTILDFRVLDSSRILLSTGGILISIGNFPEVLSQQILVGIILVGRLGVIGTLRSCMEMTGESVQHCNFLGAP